MPVAGRHSKVHKFRIVMDQPSEVAYWTRTLGTCEREMRDAIAVVGDHALRVREFLDGQRSDPMKNKKQHPASPERVRIDLDDDNDRRFWAREFRISETQLRDAISALGSDSATRVREYLRTAGMI